MRLIKFIFTVLFVTFIAACSSKAPSVHSDAYIKEAKAVRPMVIPRGATPPMQQPYYRVPTVAVQSGKGPTSLLPPDSKVLRDHNAKKTKQRHAAARLGKGSQTLLVAQNAKDTWAMVGRALRKTPYQMLDQDSGMGTYYVLDTETTNNKITQSTPIYRLSIKKKGQYSQVSVLDQKNKPANAQIATRILIAVQKQMS